MFIAHTVTGRLVELRKMTGQEERKLLSAAKGDGASKSRKKKQRENAITATQSLITSLVVSATPAIDFSTLTIGEEFDLLYLIRIFSLGPLYSYSATCPDPGCNHRAEYTIDLRAMRRDVQLCNDADCPCHAYRKYDPTDYLEDGILAADFSGIPPSHLEDAPRSIRYELPVSGWIVECQLATVDMKATMGKWADEQDSRYLSRYLGQLTRSLNGETQRREIVRLFDDLDSFDRFWLRDRLAKEDPGVDTAVEMECEECGLGFEMNVEVDGNFFLPRRVILTPWFGSLLRCQRETGKSLESWITHSKKDG